MSKQIIEDKFSYDVHSDVNQLQDKAFDLICRRHELTNQEEIDQAYDDEKAFKEYSKCHLHAFENAEAEWMLLGQIKLKELSFTENSQLKIEQKIATIIDNPRPILAMASMFLFVAFLPFMGVFQQSTPQIISQQHLPNQHINKNIKHYTTGYGYRSDYILSDGSVVNLNWNTDISVNMTQSQRLITLHKGEAYFKVAKNAKRPFIVSVGNVKAQAIGTEFNVNKRADNFSDIAVTEGIVAVSTTESSQEPQKKTLLANQMITSQNDKLSAINRSSSEKINAWQQGIIIFEKRPLHEALEEINRYTNDDIIIDLKASNNNDVTAIFFIDSANDAMYSLIELFNLQIEKQHKRIIITEKS